jgi:hypothetical protein
MENQHKHSIRPRLRILHVAIDRCPHCGGVVEIQGDDDRTNFLPRLYWRCETCRRAVGPVCDEVRVPVQHEEEGPCFRVLYSKEPTFVDSDPPITIEQLHETHVFVREVRAPTLEAVFSLMQAERWPPREARSVIRKLGLTHTSMSVGDVIQDENGRFHECLMVGWREIG